MEPAAMIMRSVPTMSVRGGIIRPPDVPYLRYIPDRFIWRFAGNPEPCIQSPMVQKSVNNRPRTIYVSGQPIYRRGTTLCSPQPPARMRLCRHCRHLTPHAGGWAP